MQPGKIWIVDDQAATRAWLGQAIRNAFPEAAVAEAASLASARKLRLDSGWPDLALIDLRLPDGDGVELITELHAACPQALCVVPTIFDDDAYLFAALRAGARGYLLKDQPVERIAEQLRGLAAGAAPPLSPSLARRILHHLESNDTAPGAAERQLLQLRARGLPLSEALQQSGQVPETLHAILRLLAR